MSKGLEALKDLENHFKTSSWAKETDFTMICFEIEKELKAIEIIKEKRVDVCYFMNCRTLEEYNDDVLGSYAYEEDDAEQRMLTQEDYDLLKEVLG